MPNALSSLSAQQLRKAASLRDKIDTLEKQLTSILGPAPAPKPAAKPAAKRRRKLSKAARAKLSASAKARWAKVKAAGKTSL